MDFIRERVASFLLPMLIGPAVFYGMRGLKAAASFVDKQGPLVQRGVAIALSAGLVALSKFVPGQEFVCAVDQACTFTDIGPDAIKAVLGAAVAFLIHFKAKQDPKVA